MIKQGPFTVDEDKIIIDAVIAWGNKGKLQLQFIFMIMNNLQKQILNVNVIVYTFIKNNINNVMYYDDSYIIRMNGCQVFNSEEEAFNKFHGYSPAIIVDDDDEEEEDNDDVC